MTSQIKSLKNYFRKFSLVSELNFRFPRNLLKITLRKIIFYFLIPKFGYLRFQSPTPLHDKTCNERSLERFLIEHAFGPANNFFQALVQIKMYYHATGSFKMRSLNIAEFNSFLLLGHIHSIGSSIDRCCNQETLQLSVKYL